MRVQTMSGGFHVWFDDSGNAQAGPPVIIDPPVPPRDEEEGDPEKALHVATFLFDPYEGTGVESPNDNASEEDSSDYVKRVYFHELVEGPAPIRDTDGDYNIQFKVRLEKDGPVVTYLTNGAYPDIRKNSNKNHPAPGDEPDRSEIKESDIAPIAIMVPDGAPAVAISGSALGQGIPGQRVGNHSFFPLEDPGTTKVRITRGPDGDINIRVERDGLIVTDLRYAEQASMVDQNGDLVAYVDRFGNLYVNGSDGSVFLIHRSRVVSQWKVATAYPISSSIYDIKAEDTVRTYEGNTVVEFLGYSANHVFMLDQIKESWSTMWDPRATAGERVMATAALTFYLVLDALNFVGGATPVLSAVGKGVAGVLGLGTRMARAAGLVRPAAETAALVAKTEAAGVMSARAAAATEGSMTFAAGTAGRATAAITVGAKVITEIALEAVLNEFADRLPAEAISGPEKWRRNLRKWMNGSNPHHLGGQFGEWLSNEAVRQRYGVDLVGDKLLHFTTDNGLDMLVFMKEGKRYIVEVKYSSSGAVISERELSDWFMGRKGRKPEDAVRILRDQLEKWKQQALTGTPAQRRKRAWMLDRMDEVDRTIGHLNDWLESKDPIQKVLSMVGPEGRMPRATSNLENIAKGAGLELEHIIVKGVEEELTTRVNRVLWERLARALSWT